MVPAAMTKSFIQEFRKGISNAVRFGALAFALTSCLQQMAKPILDEEKLAREHFKEDAQWYRDNIPFFECSDKDIEQVYYYRWKLYKAHIRNIGANEYVITEFINHVAWDREPYCTINAASMHHIYEGRWLKDQRYMDGYISYLLTQGGNDRRYSESVADAAYARFLVNSDSAFVVSQLDSMKSIYEKWSDHWDVSKNLYFIPAMPDATEYTIASIDASGGKDGFDGGDAFRPTINSYMYGNAMAISKIAAMKEDLSLSQAYLKKAEGLRTRVENDLWNDSLQHFTDRFKADNNYVHYWDFIRGRELAGFIPWYFNLPSDNDVFALSWKHVTDTSQLLGKYGLRTNEPSYEYYFKQFVFFQGQRGSQWNGPSWPYQTSQVLTAMANVLNDYAHKTITTADYIRILRAYTRQHFLPDGTINLVENYDPNEGGPIVYYYWSNHYNHSSYNNLIITGLCGIRPSAGDSLVINPLVDESIKYFLLDDLRYHGHRLSVVYDEDGSRYHVGKGVTVFVDGKMVDLTREGDAYTVRIGAPEVIRTKDEGANYALNISRRGYPIPSASINAVNDSIYQAIDGRIWYFTEITNRWTTAGSKEERDWFAIDFGESREISAARISFVDNDRTFDVPLSVHLEYFKDEKWLPVTQSGSSERTFVGNTSNIISFDKVATTKVRLTFEHSSRQVAVSEIECY